jgi:hypothetical protein
MLKDDRSPKNTWQDKDKEAELKKYYASRKKYYDKRV